MKRYHSNIKYFTPSNTTVSENTEYDLDSIASIYGNVLTAYLVQNTSMSSQSRQRKAEKLLQLAGGGTEDYEERTEIEGVELTKRVSDTGKSFNFTFKNIKRIDFIKAVSYSNFAVIIQSETTFTIVGVVSLTTGKVIGEKTIQVPCQHFAATGNKVVAVALLSCRRAADYKNIYLSFQLTALTLTLYDAATVGGRSDQISIAMTGDSSYQFIKSRYNVFYGKTFVKICDLRANIIDGDPCYDQQALPNTLQTKFVNDSPYPIIFSYSTIQGNQYLNGVVYFYNSSLSKVAAAYNFRIQGEYSAPIQDWKCNWIGRQGITATGNISCAVIHSSDTLEIINFNLSQTNGTDWKFETNNTGRSYYTLPDAGELKQFDFLDGYLVLRSVRKSNNSQVLTFFTDVLDLQIFWTVDIDPKNTYPQIFIWQKDAQGKPELAILDNESCSASLLDSEMGQAKPTSTSLIFKRNAIGGLKLKLTKNMTLDELGKILIRFSPEGSATQKSSELTLKSFFVQGGGPAPGAGPGPKPIPTPSQSPSPSNKPGGGPTEIIIWIVVLSLIIVIIIVAGVIILRKRSSDDLSSLDEDLYEPDETDDQEVWKEEATL